MLGRFSLRSSQCCRAHHTRQTRHEGGDQQKGCERQQQMACDQPFKGGRMLWKRDGTEHAVSFRQPEPRKKRKREEVTGWVSNPDLLKGKNKADNG